MSPTTVTERNNAAKRSCPRNRVNSSAAGAVVGLATGLRADDLDGEQAAMPSFWVVLRSAAFLAIAFVLVAGPEPTPLWGTGLALFAVLVLGRLVLPSTPTR